jgi:hypothetical protein
MHSGRVWIMSETLRKVTVDDYEIEQTSYRSWKVITPKGDIYYVWADPELGILKCGCYYATMYKRPRMCKHMRMIKAEYDTQ